MKFFKSLEIIKYDGNLTVECTRGDNHLKTAKRNIIFINNYLKKTGFI
ncbi:hypothetical protein OAY90_04130 [Candidatus Pelagibacter sp.]|nr:hypothetical protein [Candidatus Pelagibacter sp.]